MYAEIQQYIERVLPEIDSIPESRRKSLEEVASFVSAKRANGEAADLNFICTHNSRRSQLGQLWAAVAAAHFGIDDVRTYSGGTEVTAFNPRAVSAIERAGFAVQNPGGENPRYQVSFQEPGPAIVCFSKTYDDPHNPKDGFAAIMTCSAADEACPIVVGAALRAPIRYGDPKAADGTPDETAAYDERSRQIATEMLYLFARVT